MQELWIFDGKTGQLVQRCWEYPDWYWKNPDNCYYHAMFVEGNVVRHRASHVNHYEGDIEWEMNMELGWWGKYLEWLKGHDPEVWCSCTDTDPDELDCWN